MFKLSGSISSVSIWYFFFSSRRRHTRCALVTGVQTCALPISRFLDYWAQISEAEALRQLQQDDRDGERSVFLRTHHIVDIVRRFPVPGITAQGLIGALRPLQPRLYSIASSLAAAPDEAHLTVAPVRYALHGEDRKSTRL